MASKKLTETVRLSLLRHLVPPTVDFPSGSLMLASPDTVATGTQLLQWRRRQAYHCHQILRQQTGRGCTLCTISEEVALRLQ